MGYTLTAKSSEERNKLQLIEILQTIPKYDEMFSYIPLETLENLYLPDWPPVYQADYLTRDGYLTTPITFWVRDEGFVERMGYDVLTIDDIDSAEQFVKDLHLVLQRDWMNMSHDLLYSMTYACQWVTVAYSICDMFSNDFYEGT
jgi:hypothetical protein